VHAYPTWLDGGALRREVLDPLGPGGAGLYLPSLRDPLTNRATREPYQHAPGGAVVIVAGELLLGRELPFDLTIHLAVTPAARARRTDRAVAWTLPALDAYDADSDPANRADIAIRYDDPEHPAIST
ncbi:MAG: uridine kinase, partial [Pseudonocardiales bacterium]|nr:uridine kinase [Pseudonocardiales bacterium]